MQYWLAKSEPDTYSIDDLKRDKKTLWEGVRNYQARNNLKAMQPGDQILFYHSNATPPGVIGIAQVSKAAQPDPTQFDKESDYYDAKATPENPRWFCPEVIFKEKFSEIIPLEILRNTKVLTDLPLVQKGTRLSVMPISKVHFEVIKKLVAKQ